MEQQETVDHMLPNGMTSEVPLQIKGITYFTASNVRDVVGISRQTLWRWRREGKIPAGVRLRQKLLFTASELELIREFATHVEPAEVGGKAHGQMYLFGTQKRGEET